MAAALLFYWVDVAGAEAAVQDFLLSQQGYLDNFAAALPELSEAAAEARARLYAAGLNRFVTELRLKAEPHKMLRWQYNPEAHHCPDCVELDGQVRTAADWYREGLYPRSGMTQCLMNCRCDLVEV